MPLASDSASEGWGQGADVKQLTVLHPEWKYLLLPVGNFAYAERWASGQPQGPAPWSVPQKGNLGGFASHLLALVPWDLWTGWSRDCKLTGIGCEFRFLISWGPWCSICYPVTSSTLLPARRVVVVPQSPSSYPVRSSH